MLNVEALKLDYQARPALRALLSHLLTRSDQPRNTSRIATKRWARRMSEALPAWRPSEFEQELQWLASRAVGSFKGRHFHWHYMPLDVAKAARGEDMLVRKASFRNRPARRLLMATVPAAALPELTKARLLFRKEGVEIEASLETLVALLRKIA